MANPEAQGKTLVIFDFDNSLIEGNTDFNILDLHNDMAEIKAKHRNDGWATVMSAALHKLKELGFTRSDVDKSILSLDYIEGARELCHWLAARPESFHCIIMSHSNIHFIDLLLPKADLQNMFSCVCTYDAEWIDKDTLSVRPYNTVTEKCPWCPIDFCKGSAVDSYIQRISSKKGNEFTSKIYIGDGRADLCPVLSFGQDDAVFCRRDFTLHKLITGKKQAAFGEISLRCQVLPWINCNDILDGIRTLMSRPT